MSEEVIAEIFKYCDAMDDYSYIQIKKLSEKVGILNVKNRDDKDLLCATLSTYLSLTPFIYNILELEMKKRKVKVEMIKRDKTAYHICDREHVIKEDEEDAITKAVSDKNCFGHALKSGNEVIAISTYCIRQAEEIYGVGDETVGEITLICRKQDVKLQQGRLLLFYTLYQLSQNVNKVVIQLMITNFEQLLPYFQNLGFELLEGSFGRMINHNIKNTLIKFQIEYLNLRD